MNEKFYLVRFDAYIFQNFKPICDLDVLRPPANLDTTNATSTSFVVTWEPVRGATSYIIRVINGKTSTDSGKETDIVQV